MYIPLYEKMRPQSLEEIVGHEALIGPAGILKCLIKEQKPQSILLYGPPGCGKTTLAKIYAKAFDLPFRYLSCVSGSMEEIKQELKNIQNSPLFHSQVLFFLDELHRLNKSQQDYLLPFLEKGTLILVGATTENPSFHFNGALLSRLRVLILEALDTSSLLQILNANLKNYPHLLISEDIKNQMVDLSQGDARFLLNLLENLLNSQKTTFTSEDLEKILIRKLPRYDKDQDQHYHTISALHKAIRGSDVDASLYWLCRMLVAGEDREYILRRLTRIATEDVGLADPHALSITIAAWETFNRLGIKEGDLALAEATIYLALSPKSNKTYLAFEEAIELAKQTSHLPIPPHLINSVDAFSKMQGHGKDYIYEPNTPLGISEQNFFPDGLKDISFYNPQEKGFERELKKRKDYFHHVKSLLKKKPSP